MRRSALCRSMCLCTLALLVSALSRAAVIMHDSVDRRQQPTKNASTSVVIWHGFGDRYDNPAFTTMIQDIRDELGNDTFVHVIRLSEDGAADSKATVFGHMASQVEQVANQLKDLPQLADAHFDAIGFSQGGVFFRGYVELFGQNPLYEYMMFRLLRLLRADVSV